MPAYGQLDTGSLSAFRYDVLSSTGPMNLPPSARREVGTMIRSQSFNSFLRHARAATGPGGLVVYGNRHPMVSPPSCGGVPHPTGIALRLLLPTPVLLF